MRVAMLLAILLMALYVIFQMHHLSLSTAKTDPTGQELQERAALGGARAEARLATLRAALIAARQQSNRDPSDPIEAAELVIKAGAPDINAAAVVDESGVLARSGGPAKGADLLKAARAARAAGKPVWISGSNDWLYAVVSASGPRGPVQIVAATEAASLIGDDAIAPVQAIATPMIRP